MLKQKSGSKFSPLAIMLHDLRVDPSTIAAEE
jgi:hypothetical protein